ncbi:MAG: CsgG/HfaB family protein [Thermodesulfobacteriota bacterium]|nr:CsgG/HfaB family protein [Thermodesulfobacteriota bacterium]
MEKKITILVLGILAVCFSFSGCTSLEQYTQPQAEAVSTVPASLPPYSGPKARIAVRRFDVRAARAHYAIGDGLRDMLATSLVQSQRFSVVERQELGSVLEEQELCASGAVEKSTQVARGKIKGADLIIVGAVTEFEPGASGGKVGVGGGGGVGGALLGAVVRGAMNKAHLAIDLRIINTTTSEIINVAKIEGEAKDIKMGGIAGAFFGGGALGGGLSSYAKTPMEKAIRVCIGKATEYLSQSIPHEYYKY